jgi:hypothetical protein
VGGDAWEWWGGSNRYLSITMPLFFVLFAEGLSRIAGFIGRVFEEKNSFVKRYMMYGTAVLFVVSLVNFNQFNDRDAIQVWVLGDPPLHVRDNQEAVENALYLEQITSPDARIGVVWAGVVPYFTDRFAIDLLGKNDRTIAHLDMRVTPGLLGFWDFYPGHLKWDYSYSIGQLQPDVVERLWNEEEEAQPYLENDYIAINFHADEASYLLENSSHILWNRVSEIAES